MLLYKISKLPVTLCTGITSGKLYAKPLTCVISTDIVIQQRIQLDQDNTDGSTMDDTTQCGLNVLHNSNNIS